METFWYMNLNLNQQESMIINLSTIHILIIQPSCYACFDEKKSKKGAIRSMLHCNSLGALHAFHSDSLKVANSITVPYIHGDDYYMEIHVWGKIIVEGLR